MKLVASAARIIVIDLVNVLIRQELCRHVQAAQHCDAFAAGHGAINEDHRHVLPT